MSLSAGVTVAVLAVLGPSVPQDVTVEVAPQVQTVREYVEEYFADEPIMIAIAQCESEFKQFTKHGAPVKNPKSSAIGIFQVMSSLHTGTASTLGLDIKTVEGNAAYARYLYEKEGTRPWNASKACWGKSEAHLATAAN